MDGEQNIRAARKVGPKAALRDRAERGAREVAADLIDLAKRDEVSWDAFDAFVTWCNRVPTISDRREGLGTRLPMEWFGSPLHTSELTPAMRLAWRAFEPAFQDAIG